MLKVEFSPFRSSKIVHEGFIRDDKFSYVRSLLPATETAPPNNTAFLLETIVKVCPNRGLGISPVTLTFS